MNLKKCFFLFVIFVNLLCFSTINSGIVENEFTKNTDTETRNAHISYVYLSPEDNFGIALAKYIFAPEFITEKENGLPLCHSLVWLAMNETIESSIVLPSKLAVVIYTEDDKQHWFVYESKNLDLGRFLQSENEFISKWKYASFPKSTSLIDAIRSVK